MDRDAIIARFGRNLTWSSGLRSRARLEPVLDLGVADAFELPDLVIREALSGALDEFEEHTYSFDRYDDFSESAAEWLSAEFGCTVDPAAILHTLGAKGGLAMASVGLLEAGSVAVVTVPGYPFFESWARLLGATVVTLPLLPQNDFLPALDSIPVPLRRRVRAVLVNYPNNPTAKVAAPAELGELLSFCRREGMTLLNDAAYASVVFTGGPRPSLLAAADPQDEVLEIHSLSKAFQMPGWRLGFVAGNHRLVARLRRVRPLLDSGQFRAVQRAGALALRKRPGVARRNAALRRRLLALSEVLRDAGFEVRPPQGTPFLYVLAPSGTANGFTFPSALDAAKFLFDACGVLVTPWDDAGAYLRFSAAFRCEAGREEEWFATLRRRLASVELRFGPEPNVDVPARFGGVS